MTLIERVFRKILSQSDAGRKYLKLREVTGYFVNSGWFKSVEEGLPFDAEHNPLPWYTYSFIDFISDRINSEMKIFEYGSGNSTLWWSQRVNRVVSCEHEKPWYETIAGKVPENVDYRYCELELGGEYSQLISTFTAEFDCVVIDGRDRVHCAMNTIPALKNDGVVIWDNSDREKYREGYQLLQDNGFRRLDFWGLGPICRKPWCTSVFYRSSNCLGI